MGLGLVPGDLDLVDRVKTLQMMFMVEEEEEVVNTMSSE